MQWQLKKNSTYIVPSAAVCRRWWLVCKKIRGDISVKTVQVTSCDWRQVRVMAGSCAGYESEKNTSHDVNCNIHPHTNTTSVKLTQSFAEFLHSTSFHVHFGFHLVRSTSPLRKTCCWHSDFWILTTDSVQGLLRPKWPPNTHEISGWYSRQTIPIPPH